MIICGPAWYTPQPDIHRCSTGATWNATVIPSDRYSGLASPAEGVWVATGHGAAPLASATAISVDNGSTWAAGGTIPNNAGATPEFLAYGNGRLLARSSLSVAVSLDRGTTWTNSGGSVPSNCPDMQFGGAQFVFVDGTSALVVVTPDGSSFTSFVTPAVLQRVFWDAYRSRWLCLESAGVRTWTTTDFVTFTLQGNMPAIGQDITSNNMAQNPDTGSIVAVYNGASANAIRTTDGGATWANTGPTAGSQHQQAIYGNGGFIIMRQVGGVNERSNDDGLTWTSVGPFTAVQSWVTRWDGINTYVAVGATGAPGTTANLSIC